MWDRKENRKGLLCQYLRTGQLFKPGPASFHEYNWRGELKCQKEGDDAELHFCGMIFLSEHKISIIKIFTRWALDIIVTGTIN